MQHDFYARAFRIERLGGSPESLPAAISSSEHGPRRSMNIFLSHGMRKFSVPRKSEPPTMKKRWESALGRTSARFKRTGRPLGKGEVQAAQRGLEPRTRCNNAIERDRRRPSQIPWSEANGDAQSGLGHPRGQGAERNSGLISMAWMGRRTVDKTALDAAGRPARE